MKVESCETEIRGNRLPVLKIIYTCSVVPFSKRPPNGRYKKWSLTRGGL